MADLGAISVDATSGDSGGGSAVVGPTEKYLGQVKLELAGAHKTPLLGPVDVVYFPPTLPRATYSGYTLAPHDQVIRSNMDGGVARARRRTRMRNDQVSLTWDLSDSEMASFREWFDSSSGAAGGAAWFTGMELATGDIDVRPVEARFTGPWQANLDAGMRWIVTAKVEVR